MTPPTRRAAWVALAVLLIVALAALRYRPAARRAVLDFWTPLARGEQGLTGSPGANTRFSRSKLELIQELEHLEAVRDAATSEHRQVELLRAENQELRAQLGLPRPPGWRLVTARVITRDPAAGGRRLGIACGLADGVAPGLAVTSRGYLLGRVVECGAHYATVMTVADPQCAVSARVEVGGQPAYGILHGLGQEQWRSLPHCALTNLPRDLAYESDVPVETSSFSQMLPAGLPIGSLCASPAGTVTATVNSLYKNAWVMPGAFEQDFTIVAVWVPQSLPANLPPGADLPPAADGE